MLLRSGKIGGLQGLRRFAHKAIRKIGALLLKPTVQLRWFLFSKIPGWKGIKTISSNERIIVSLTSFPARIGTVDQTIKSLLLQSKKPDKIVLWLAESQFPSREETLPKRLLRLKQYGLDIEWCEDIRSYKKLIPTIKLYPNEIIVTTDDDIFYRKTWLSILFEEYRRNPKVIWAHRVTKFYIKGDQYSIIAGGDDYWMPSSNLNKVTGCGGILYPPKCFHPDVIREELFMKLCPTNDDIWFWLMAVLNGTQIAVPQRRQNKLVYVADTQKGPTLSKINDQGEGLFWRDFNSILEYYPELDVKLRTEYQQRTAIEGDRY